MKTFLLLLLSSLTFAATSSQRITATTPLHLTSGVMTIQQASTSQSGFLSATDWNHFNSSGSPTWGGITGTLSNQTDLQNALNLKANLSAPSFTTSSTFSYATASTVPVFNSSKQLISSSTTTTQLGFLDASSSIQTQLNGKQATLSGTSGRLTKWSSSSGIGSSLWAESSLGVWSNAGTAKGTNLLPLIEMDSVNHSGIFLDPSFGRVSISTDGAEVVEFGGNPELYISDGTPGGTTVGLRNYLGLSIRQYGGGFGALNYFAPAGANSSSVNLLDSDGHYLLQVEGTPYTNDPDPNEIYFSGQGTNGGGGNSAFGDQVDAITISRGGSITTGGRWGRGNGITINSRLDWDMSNTGCTTTVSSSKTIVGSGCHFTNDFGVKGQLSVSTASTFFTQIESIADDNHMVVLDNVGNGSTQTFIRRMAPFSMYDHSSNLIGYVTADGSAVLGAPSLAQNSTVGFVYIPKIAGVPSGVPQVQVGYVAEAWDSVDHVLYIYDGSWRAMN